MDSYEDFPREEYQETTEHTYKREPEWVTFATPICIGIAILICFTKVMCRNCISTRRTRRIESFAPHFPAPPKYEDVIRAKEEEEEEEDRPPQYYPPTNSNIPTSPTEHGAPPDYSSMPRPIRPRRTTTVRQLEQSIDDQSDESIQVVVHSSGRENAAYQSDSETSSDRAQVHQSPRPTTVGPVILSIEDLSDISVHSSRC